jgi:hypothetical protein
MSWLNFPPWKIVVGLIFIAALAWILLQLLGRSSVVAFEKIAASVLDDALTLLGAPALFGVLTFLAIAGVFSRGFEWAVTTVADNFWQKSLVNYWQDFIRKVEQCASGRLSAAVLDAEGGANEDGQTPAAEPSSSPRPRSTSVTGLPCAPKMTSGPFGFCSTVSIAVQSEQALKCCDSLLSLRPGLVLTPTSHANSSSRAQFDIASVYSARGGGPQTARGERVALVP